jgi:hypothetical protein
LGAVTLQGRNHIARGIVEPLQRFAVNLEGMRSAPAKPLEESSRRVGGGATGMPNQRQIEIVAK